MAEIVSLSQLFATGRLGALHAGLSLNEAAAALGPPVSWSQRTEPLHGEVWVWNFGELELVYSAKPPWPFLFFTIEGLSSMHEQTLVVRDGRGPAIVVELDGINQEIRPSEALSLVQRRGDPAQVLYWPPARNDTLRPSLLIIAASDVAVSFEVWDNEIEGDAGLAALADAELWRVLEANADVDRIICGTPATGPVVSTLAAAPRRLDPAACLPGPRGDRASAVTYLASPVAHIMLADFLATGRLGPVHCGLNRNQVALALGAPDGWIARRSGEEFPSYWCYGKLELSFDPDPPHAMNFFQIEFASRLSGDCEILAGGKIVLALQGLSGRSRPSDVLRLIRDDGRPWLVHYSGPTGSGALTVCNESVMIVFGTEFPDEITSELAAMDDAAYLKQCDRYADLDSIYVYPRLEARLDTKFTVSAAAYLAAMG